MSGEQSSANPFKINLKNNKQLEIKQDCNYNLLVVSNLAHTVDNYVLFDTFRCFGKMIQWRVAHSKNGHSTGQGFVQFRTEEAANMCMEQMDGVLLHNKKIYIRRFLPKNAVCDFNLYVGNLDLTIDNEKFHTEFSKFGTIMSAVVMKNLNGSSKGYGFVQFSSSEEAIKAINEMNGCILGTKQLYIKYAHSKNDQKLLDKKLKKPQLELKLKEVLGELLLPHVEQYLASLAGKVMGKLLELDNSVLVHLLEHNEALKAKVDEILQAHQVK